MAHLDPLPPLADQGPGGRRLGRELRRRPGRRRQQADAAPVLRRLSRHSRLGGRLPRRPTPTPSGAAGGNWPPGPVGTKDRHICAGCDRRWVEGQPGPTPAPAVPLPATAAE